MPNSTFSNFGFLRKEFPLLYSLGTEAEFQLHYDAVSALFKLRLFGGKLVDHLFAEHHCPRWWRIPSTGDWKILSGMGCCPGR